MISIASSLFWGIIIVVVGILIILRMFSVFRDMSVFRIIIGLIIIYFGLTLIIGKNIIVLKKNHGSLFKYNENYLAQNSDKQEIIFGSQNIDLTNVGSKLEKNINLAVVFGSGKIKVNKNAKLNVTGNVAFGSIVLPENNKTFFGQINYSSPGAAEEKTAIHINSDVVFGSLEVIRE